MPVRRQGTSPVRASRSPGPGPDQRAWAPTGRVHPPPSSARKARSASTRGTRPASSMAASAPGWPRRPRGTRRPARPGPPGAASSRAPGPRLHPAGAAQSRRSRAALATTTAAIPAVPAAASRVARLPRSPAKLRSGRRLASCTRRRAEPVATVAPVGACRAGRPDQHVAGIGPLGEGGQDQPGRGQLGRGRQVLGRVDGDVGVAPRHRGLDLFDEDPPATEPIERDVGPRSPDRLDDHQATVGTPERSSSAATRSACQRASGDPRVASRRAGRRSRTHDRPATG